jgi:hypothetical protein
MRRGPQVVLWFFALSAWAADLWFIWLVGEFLPYRQQTGWITTTGGLSPWNDIGDPLIVAGIVVGVLFAWVAQRLQPAKPTEERFEVTRLGVVRYPASPGLQVPISESAKRAVRLLRGTEPPQRRPSASWARYAVRQERRQARKDRRRYG